MVTTEQIQTAVAETRAKSTGRSYSHTDGVLATVAAYRLLGLKRTAYRVQNKTNSKGEYQGATSWIKETAGSLAVIEHRRELAEAGFKVFYGRNWAFTCYVGVGYGSVFGADGHED